jgi:hypothetical protein
LVHLIWWTWVRFSGCDGGDQGLVWMKLEKLWLFLYYYIYYYIFIKIYYLFYTYVLYYYIFSDFSFRILCLFSVLFLISNVLQNLRYASELWCVNLVKSFELFFFRISNKKTSFTTTAVVWQKPKRLKILETVKIWRQQLITL